MSELSPSSTIASEATPVWRWLAVAVSATGIIAACILLWTTWSGASSPLFDALSSTVMASGTLLMAGFALLIAWKAGDRRGNVAMAVAFAYVFSVDTIYQVVFPFCAGSDVLLRLLRMTLFALGGGFYLHAAQMFPSQLFAPDIASSPTIWGRIRMIRTVLTQLLRPWVLVATMAGLAVLAFLTPLTSPTMVRLLVIVIGAAFFHISYSSGKPEVRRKVLWFLQVVIAVLVTSIIGLVIRKTIAPTLDLATREYVYIGLNAAQILVVFVCFSLALFYAGAMSPNLVLRKTFIYGASIALFLFCFSVLQEFVVESAIDHINVSGRLLEAVLAALLGLIFYPVVRKLEKAFSRTRDAV